ncbi:MAG: methyltransferase domain-containing protein [Hyphomicrobiaceae bacterium]|nr:methyltransferase domain-containing protein [Hyphomicrobiaceae bacterium]
MPAGQQVIFDRRLLAKRRDRSASAIGSADFLLRRAAEDMVTRLQSVLRDFPDALDLGCHHGLLNQMLLNDPRIGTLFSADLSLAFAAHCPGLKVVCDEEFLPFTASSLDLVASCLTLHHVNDLPGTLVQIRRALKPDGLFLAAVLGGQTLHELRAALAQAEEEVDGGVSPRVAPFADVRDLGALLQRAGFALPVTDADHVNVTYPTMFELMRDIRAMGASNTLAERRRTPLKRALLLRAAEIYAENFSNPNGQVRATFEIIHMTGWVPDPSQPKPLKPGSAKARLADALGTEEVSTGEKAGKSGD